MCHGTTVFGIELILEAIQRKRHLPKNSDLSTNGKGTSLLVPLSRRNVSALKRLRCASCLGQFYSEDMNLRHTGEGTWRVWPVGVSLPSLGSMRKTTTLLLS